MRHKPPTLEEIGLQNYLESSKETHDGYGYSDFLIMWQDKKLNKSSIAKLFSVDRRTVARWIEAYQKESEVKENEI